MRLSISLLYVLLGVFPVVLARLGRDEDIIDSVVEEDAAFWLRALGSISMSYNIADENYIYDWTKCGEICTTDADCGTPTPGGGCFKCELNAKVCVDNSYDWTKCGETCKTDEDCETPTSGGGCSKCELNAKVCVDSHYDADKVFDWTKCGTTCKTDEDCETTSPGGGCVVCDPYARVCT